ncbi:MAG: MipA/OmpV family protein [Limnohabitans sp.]
MNMKHTAWAWGLAVIGAAAQAQSTFPDRFVGEAGGMVATAQSVVQGGSATATALPYVYGDWGRLYARVDTFGVKTLPLGEGHLELAARVSTEGYKARKTDFVAAGDRSTPVPVGLGTFQRTALGGVFAYVFHDTTSGGQLLELTWAARVPLGRATLYPQLGLEHRTAAYVQHLYGVTAAQAGAGLSSYQAGASTVPVLSLQATVPLQGPWALQLQTRYRAWDSAVRNSPLVDRSSQLSGYAALTYSWN